MTKQEAVTLIAQLEFAFDIVRLVDVTMTRQMFINSSGELVMENYDCYAVWNKNARCDNCISAQVFACKGKMTKFEFVNEDIYYVIARYIEIDGEPYVLEMVSRIDDKTFFGAYGKSEFADTISDYNRKLYTDPLTGAHNRQYFEEQLLGLAYVEALAMLDVDNFKVVNDTYGHRAGDMALRAIVDTISSCLRDADTVIRYGGDEFTLVLWNIPREVFAKRLEKIREKVTEISIDEFPGLQLTISIGAVCQSMPVMDALQEADKMLYLAKEEKNRVQLK